MYYKQDEAPHLTVGEIRKLLEDFPDDMPVHCRHQKDSFIQGPLFPEYTVIVHHDSSHILMFFRSSYYTTLAGKPSVYVPGGVHHK